MRRRKIIAQSTRGRGFRLADAERLFSGQSPDEPTLGILVEALGALKRAEGPAPTEAEALEFAAAAKQVLDVPREHVSHIPSMSGAVRRRKLRLKPVLVGGLALLVLMVSVSAGVAHAANEAIPGDSLYGLDLALEKIGIGDGGLKERLSEASQLANQGQAMEGLELAAEAIAASAADDEGLEVAVAALRAAVEAASGDQGESGQVLTSVADMLQWMTTADPHGREFGQGVAELARAIGANPGRGPDGTGPPPHATDKTLPPQATDRTLPPQAEGDR